MTKAEIKQLKKTLENSPEGSELAKKVRLIAWTAEAQSRARADYEQTNRKTIGSRVPRHIAEDYKAAAERQGVSLNAWVNQACVVHLVSQTALEGQTVSWIAGKDGVVEVIDIYRLAAEREGISLESWVFKACSAYYAMTSALNSCEDG